jgi:hypothetical protein
VCGISKPLSEFGNGVAIPFTTCLECAKRARDRDKPPKDEKDQVKKVDPITEYLKELK